MCKKDEEVRVYATRGEAEANRPAEGSKQLFEVGIEGKPETVRWTWANNHTRAHSAVSRSIGYEAKQAKQLEELTAEQAEAKLLEMGFKVSRGNI